MQVAEREGQRAESRGQIAKGTRQVARWQLRAAGLESHSMTTDASPGEGGGVRAAERGPALRAAPDRHRGLRTPVLDGGARHLK